jgi:hypothetical protein
MCANFNKKMGKLIGEIASKKDEIILNKNAKIELEKKKKYKSILAYTFKSLEDHFTKLKISFEEKFISNSNNVLRNISDMQNSLLVELQMKNSKIKDELSVVKTTRDQFQRRKDKYFENIQVMSIDKLTRLKNQRITDDKSDLNRLCNSNGT